MPPERAWVLNFDAEDELAHGKTHTPSNATRLRAEACVPWLRASGLIGPHDVVAWPSAEVVQAERFLAWCPTRSAMREAARHGGTVVGPSMEVLRAVNHRGFCAALGQTLPGARFVRTEGELDEAFAARADVDNWLLKRAFGYAGRGRKRLRPREERTHEERAWIAASLEEGLQVEPLVSRQLDVGLHGALTSEGLLMRGAPTVQEIDDAGQWRSTRLATEGELDARELASLDQAFDEVAAALKRAGYFGPFGVDAFRYDGGFQPRSELNARYSMGWAVGMTQRPR